MRETKFYVDGEKISKCSPYPLIQQRQPLPHPIYT